MIEPQDQWVWFVDEQLVPALLQADPENSPLARRAATHTSIVSALRLHLQGASEDALRELSSAGGLPEAHLLTGQILFEMERYAEAARSYRQLAAVAPDSRASHYNLGVCLARLGDFAEGEAAFQKAVTVDPQRAQAWLGLGVCLLRERRAAEALVVLEQCLRLQADYVPALFAQAAALQMEGRHQAALAVYQWLLEDKPDLAHALSNALIAALEAGERSLVLEYAGRLLRRDHQSLPALLALAADAMDSRDYQTAANYYHRAVETSGDCYEAWFNLAICQQRPGLELEAVPAFREAARIRPASVEPREALAGILSEHGSREEAIDAWRALAEAAPDRAVAWYELGCLYYSRGEAAQAEEAFAEALKQSPNDPDTRRTLAILALDRGDAAAALKYREGLGSSAWQVTFNLALLLEKQGALEDAASLYREALEQQPDCAEALVNLGHVLATLGRTQEAKDCWVEAIRLCPELARQCLPTD